MSKSRFVLKPARVGGGASSDLTRYIAKSKLDRQREGDRDRPLFTEQRDDLTFWEARKWLSITGGALPREDVLHYVLSFERPEDYENLGKDDRERSVAVRAYLRRSLSQAAREIGVEGWRWTAGIHLNKPHPHVHILFNKNAVSRRTGELVRVEKLSTPLVAHYRERADGAREFDYGTIINSFAADVDAPLRARAQERTHDDRGGRQLGEKEAHRTRLGDRVLLGESMWARHLVERLERETEALKVYGDKRRFRLFDPTHGRVRQVSAHDIRRRAEAEAHHSISGVKFSSPTAREEARQQFLDNHLSHHEEALAEHEEKVQERLTRLETRLDQARNNHELLRPHIENLRARYKEKGEPLPVPLLSTEQVGKLQDAGIEARDVARIRALEKIRQSLAAERGTPARDPHERGRLAAQLREAETDFAARAWRERQFEQGFHLTRWEVGDERFSLASVDARLEKERVKTSFVHVGVSAWIPSWKREAQDEMARLQMVRRQVEERISARQKELEGERERAAETVRALREISDGEARSQSGREHQNPPEIIAHVYTRAELDRMESHAHTMRDPRLLMEVHEAHREKYARLSPEKSIPVHKLAAEAEARTFVAELDFRKAQAARAEQAKWGLFTPVAARLQDGSIITGSVCQTEVLSRADAIIRMVEDSPERRGRAGAITHAAALRAAETQATYDAAAAYLATARMIADDYRQELEETGKLAPRPEFSPKDLNRIDLHRAQSASHDERRALQTLLDRSESAFMPTRAGHEREFPSAGDNHLHGEREQKQHAPEPHVHTR